MGAAPAFWRAALLDMAAAAHFLSKAGLLFEVGLGCAQLKGRTFLLAFQGKTVSNRKQRVS